MDAFRVARSWTRPYSSVQWAWVKALGAEASARWVCRDRRGLPAWGKYDGAAALMAQRHGVAM